MRSCRPPLGRRRRSSLRSLTGFRHSSPQHHFSLDTRGVVAIPLDEAPPGLTPVYFYTLEQESWLLIAEAEVCVGDDCGIGGAPAVAQATLDPIPANLIALVEDRD